MAKTRVVGLDIGATAVRAVELAFGSGVPSLLSRPTLTHYGAVALPPGAVHDAEVTDSGIVAAAIRELWQVAKFTTKDVVLGVGNQRVVVRDLEVPWLPMTQLRASLPFQVQDLLPLSADEALLDYYPTGEFAGPSGRTLQGLLVAATRDTVRNNVIAAESAGLRLQVVDLNAFALIRAMARGEVAEQTVALVDVGAQVTNVVIAAHGLPRFARAIASGGQDVTSALARHMEIAGPEAENLKREIGIGFSVGPELSSGAAAIIEVTRVLIEAIRNTFVYFASNNPGATIDLVLLTGGGAQLPGFGQYLSTASRLPVAFGDPLVNIKVPSGVAESLAASRSTLAISVGLAFGVAA